MSEETDTTRHRMWGHGQTPVTRATDMPFVRGRIPVGNSSYTEGLRREIRGIEDLEDGKRSKWRFLWMTWPRAAAGPLAPA